MKKITTHKDTDLELLFLFLCLSIQTQVANYNTENIFQVCPHLSPTYFNQSISTATVEPNINPNIKNSYSNKLKEGKDHKSKRKDIFLLYHCCKGYMIANTHFYVAPIYKTETKTIVQK